MNQYSFLFIAEQHYVVWTYHNLFINSSADEHLGCFHFGAIMNSAAINIFVHVFVWANVFIYFGQISVTVFLLYIFFLSKESIEKKDLDFF